MLMWIHIHLIENVNSWQRHRKYLFLVRITCFSKTKFTFSGARKSLLYKLCTNIASLWSASHKKHILICVLLYKLDDLKMELDSKLLNNSAIVVKNVTFFCCPFDQLHLLLICFAQLTRVLLISAINHLNFIVWKKHKSLGWCGIYYLHTYVSYLSDCELSKIFNYVPFFKDW